MALPDVKQQMMIGLMKSLGIEPELVVNMMNAATQTFQKLATIETKLDLILKYIEENSIDEKAEENGEPDFASVGSVRELGSGEVGSGGGSGESGS